MNILFICGSPRKAGNTSTIIRRLKDLLIPEHKVEICYITNYQINGCVGCNHCQSIINEPGCIQHDDAALLLHKIIAADVVFYATPLYGHSYSGQLKLLMDRHVALFKFVGGSDKAVDEMEIKSLIRQKPVGLIVSCQGPEEHNTELIQMQFDLFCESSLTICFGKYIFPWCSSEAKNTKLSQTVLDNILQDVKKLA